MIAQTRKNAAMTAVAKNSEATENPYDAFANASPPLGTAMPTCMADKATERKANTAISQAKWRFKKARRHVDVVIYPLT